MDRDAIVRRETVESLVRAYGAGEAKIRQGCRLIAEAEVELSAAFADNVSFRDPHGRYRMAFEAPDGEIGEIRKQIWGALVERLEVQRMMSLEKAKELRKWLEEQSPKEEITTESVLGFFRYYVENLGVMLEEQVGEVYDFLRPRHDRYKTNSQYEIGDKVIVSGWVESSWGSGSGLQRAYHYADYFYALENVFLSLDGRGSISKSYRTELETAIEASAEGETTYFKYRACKNRNLHLTFKRKDLVAKFNAIAGGRRLRKGSDDAAA